MTEMYSIYTKEDWTEKLKDMSKNNTWREQIGIDNNGREIEYVKDEDAVKRIAAFGSVSTCYNDYIVDSAVCEMLDKMAEEIAEWILSKLPTLKIKFNDHDAIGYEVNREAVRSEKNSIQVTLRKTSTVNPEIGFFISSVIPV